MDDSDVKKILKELENQTEELRSIGANITIVAWIISFAAILAVLAFIKQANWF